MPVTIREITTEVTLEAEPREERPAEAERAAPEELEERVVRKATERVLARLRIEWER